MVQIQTARFSQRAGARTILSARGPRRDPADKIVRAPLIAAPSRYGITGFIRTILFSAFLACTAPKLAAISPSQAETEGQALATELRAQRPAKDYETSGVFKVRDGSGHRREIPVRFLVTLSDSSWRSIYEVVSPSGAVTERLIVLHADPHPNEYLWFNAHSTSPLGQPVALAVDQTMVPFAGADFWLADLGLEFFHWPEQRVVIKEMRKGRSCRVLESVNPHPSPGGYSRVRSWIDAEKGALLLAEAYDREGKLLKEFSVRSLRKVNGRWEVKEMEINNTQTGSRTRLEFNVTVD